VSGRGSRRRRASIPERGRSSVRLPRPDATPAPAARVQLVRVADVADLPAGSMKLVTVDGRDLVVVNHDGQFYALDNRCPHLGGPLGRGRIEGRVVVCPWHGWRWDVKSGRAVWPEGQWRVFRYPVVVEDGQVFVRVA
jgi:nitrite reductase (NADH) small subunit